MTAAPTLRRRALVAGAGRGLGRELVRQLAASGHEVLAGVRGTLPAGQPQDTAPVRHLSLDQSDPQAIRRLAEGLGGTRLDLLICNAAVRGDTGGLASLSQADFLEVMKVNVAGPLLLVQALLPNLGLSARPVVAMISSRAGSMAEGADPDGDYAYCCSKAALNRAVAKLADDHPPIFLALHPGWVRTDMGGAGAEVDAATSASGLLDIIDRAGPADSGRFLDYLGATVRW